MKTIKEEHDEEQGEAFKADLIGRIDDLLKFMDDIPSYKPSLWERFIMVPMLAECVFVLLYSAAYWVVYYFFVK